MCANHYHTMVNGKDDTWADGAPALLGYQRSRVYRRDHIDCP